MQLPPVRIWLYSKQLRHKARSHRQKVSADYGFSSLGSEVLGLYDKPEDILAAGKPFEICTLLLCGASSADYCYRLAS